ncbi:down syndrome cell adhesion molecule [Elysia marginata]|uniref:Down syndrome cell adhesion molecule n=1 Tax=Elysia marginata TaxID=1093978 RepID=A0AAV4FPI9_9GAST|nr:down syndrome cell adhesion molecule [Elysia marginata]
MGWRRGRGQLKMDSKMEYTHYDVTLNNKWVTRGGTAVLRCVISPSYVTDYVKVIGWQRAGHALHSSGRVSILQDGVLHIRGVQAEDAGRRSPYSCITRNVLTGENRTSGGASLRLHAAKPVMLEAFQEQFVKMGQKVTLHCKFSGNPTPQITWSLDGADLPVESALAWNSFITTEGDVMSYVNISRISVPLGGEYTCYAASKAGDSGRYTCVAQNREGKGMERSMSIEVVEPPRIDPFHFRKRKQGDRILVTCAIISGDTPITIQWEKDGRAIPQDLGVRIQQLGDYSILSINDAAPIHDGNYTCYVSNAAASVNYTASLHIDVPPRWVVEPQDSYVILHQSVRLDCQADGTPEPEVIWKKAEGATPGNYKVLEFDKPEVSHRHLLPNGTLILAQAREEDHGYYLCHATNGVGFDISKVVLLTVHIPARFNEPTRNYTVRRGEAVTLECQAVGDKPLSIAWSFRGSPIIDHDDRRVDILNQNTPRGKLSQLTIKPSTRHDSGNYTCLAKNKFGNGVFVNHLVVHEPPEPPKDLVVVNVTSREAVVAWKRPFDGNSPISNFTVQYINATEIWQGVLPNVTVKWNRLSATLPSLLPAFKYHIRVIAHNSVGGSEPSNVVDVTTEEEAPTGPPDRVIVQAVSSQALKVIWNPPVLGYQNGKILGYYIGYKETHSLNPIPASFIYQTHEVQPASSDKKTSTNEHTISNLKKFTQYSVHVKAYNVKGISPASADIKVFTLEDGE